MKVASLSKCVIELEFQLLILDSDAVLNLRLQFCCTGSPVELSHEQWRSWLKKIIPLKGGPSPRRCELPRGVLWSPRENLKYRTSEMAFPAISRVEGCH